VPSENGPVSAEDLLDWKTNYREINAQVRKGFGLRVSQDPRSGREIAKEERLAVYEHAWATQRGARQFIGRDHDLQLHQELLEEYSDFVREKIRARVTDPAIAAKLIPTDHVFSAKRVPTETDYYEAFNRDNVLLVDVKETPIERVTEQGVKTSDREYEFDV